MKYGYALGFLALVSLLLTACQPGYLLDAQADSIVDIGSTIEMDVTFKNADASTQYFDITAQGDFFETIKHSDLYDKGEHTVHLSIPTREVGDKVITIKLMKGSTSMGQLTKTVTIVNSELSDVTITQDTTTGKHIISGHISKQSDEVSHLTLNIKTELKELTREIEVYNKQDNLKVAFDLNLLKGDNAVTVSIYHDKLLLDTIDMNVVASFVPGAQFDFDTSDNRYTTNAEAVPGISNTGYQILKNSNGIIEFVNITYDQAYDLAEFDQSTITFWIKPDRVDRKKVFATDLLNGSDNAGFSIANHPEYNSEITAYYKTGDSDANTYIIHSRNANLKKDTWHFIALTYTGSSVQLYVDGNLVGEDTTMVKTGITNTLDNIYIGRDASSVNYFDGVIDEFKIYNQVLSSSVIKKEYEDLMSN